MLPIRAVRFIKRVSVGDVRLRFGVVFCFQFGRLFAGRFWNPIVQSSWFSENLMRLFKLNLWIVRMWYCEPTGKNYHWKYNKEFGLWMWTVLVSWTTLVNENVRLCNYVRWLVRFSLCDARSNFHRRTILYLHYECGYKGENGSLSLVKPRNFAPKRFPAPLKKRGKFIRDRKKFSQAFKVSGVFTWIWCALLHIIRALFFLVCVFLHGTLKIETFCFPICR